MLNFRSYLELLMEQIVNNLVVILLAGGIGNRINTKISKQMFRYNNKTILEKNIVNLKKNLKDIPIQVVSNEKDLPNVNKIIKKYNI